METATTLSTRDEEQGEDQTPDDEFLCDCCGEPTLFCPNLHFETDESVPYFLL